MRKFRINEISAVDSPAQEGARAVIMKRYKDDRRKKNDEVNKRLVMTSSNNEHDHLIKIDSYAIESGGGQTIHDYNLGHVHNFVIDASGGISIGETLGHTHTVTENVNSILTDYMKSTNNHIRYHNLEIMKMKDENEKTTELEKQIDMLKTELEFAKKLNGLTGEYRDYYENLEKQHKEAFLNLSKEEMDNAIEVAKADNAVVYTSDSGEKFYKKDDVRLIEMAKQVDNDRREMKKEREQRAIMELNKQAETELSNLPGDKETHVALLKAVNEIEDEKVREATIDVLKAHNAKHSDIYKVAGIQMDDENNDSDKLTQMAKELAKKEGIDFYKAYERVSLSNPELFSKAVQS